MNTQNTAVVEDGEEEVVTRGRRGKPLDKYAARRIRSGKTQRDHANGSWKARLENLSMRAAWINETRGKNYGSVDTVPRMHKAHGNGNGAKRFKLKAGKIFKG